LGHFGGIVKLQLIVVDGSIWGCQSERLDEDSLRVVYTKVEIATDRCIDIETFRYTQNILVLMLKELLRAMNQYKVNAPSPLNN